jgi:hypothetical protein
MNQVVNWFILIFIFVFDPLAITLLIAAQIANKKTDLSDRNINTIMEANENPPAPNDSLKNAAEQYKQFKETQYQHIVDMMKADEEDGLYDDLDSTLTDGLEDEQWGDDDKAFIENLTKNELSEEKKDKKENKRRRFPRIV